MENRIAVFPGSFDPFTKGHEDVVLRALPLFDKLVIGIGTNASKSRYFSIGYMIEKIQETFKDFPQVEVISFNGLTAEFAKTQNAKFILRGLRNTTDFEYENTIAQANRVVNSELETVFLITSPTVAFISSSIVRDLHKHGAEVSQFMPFAVKAEIG